MLTFLLGSAHFFELSSCFSDRPSISADTLSWKYSLGNGDLASALFRSGYAEFLALSIFKLVESLIIAVDCFNNKALSVTLRVIGPIWSRLDAKAIKP